MTEKIDKSMQVYVFMNSKTMLEDVMSDIIIRYTQTSHPRYPIWYMESLLSSNIVDLNTFMEDTTSVLLF